MVRLCARHRSFQSLACSKSRNSLSLNHFPEQRMVSVFVSLLSSHPCPDSGRLLTKTGPPASTSTQIHVFLAGPTLFFCQAASKRSYQPIIMLQSCFPAASSFACQSMGMLLFGVRAVMRVVSSFLLHSRVIDVGEVGNLVGR